MIEAPIVAAGLLVPPGLIDPTDIPIHPALMLDARLRDYQMLVALKVARAMREGYRRILVVMPTGAGKTRLAAAMMRSTIRVGLTGEFQVHRKELIKQTSGAFAGLGIEHGFIASGYPFNPDLGVTIAGVQTLVKRLGLIVPANFVVVDECHRLRANTYEQILQAYGRDMYLIGLTASPQRLDGQGLGEHFDIIIEGPTVAELIARGYLCGYEYLAPDIPDMSGVDPDSAAAAERVDKPRVIGNIVKTYMEHGLGMQGIVFAATREHSRHIATALTAAGIPAMHVDGTMDAERERFDDEFRAGQIRIGVNVGLFGEGYDVPNVGYVGIAAPTKSLVNHLQWCGRALRPAAGKPYAVIADHAGNALPSWLGGRGLGLPDDDREWSLAGRDKRKREQDWTSITQCLSCFRVYPSSAPECPGCRSNTPAQPRVVKTEDGKLSKIEREALKKAATERRKQEERQCASFDEFVSLGRARGYEFPRQWAKKQCQLRRLPAC